MKRTHRQIADEARAAQGSLLEIGQRYPLIVPAPALWSLTGELLLPEKVMLISLDQPFAGLVADGVKTIETRTWPWPYQAGWLAIYATLHPRTAVIKKLGCYQYAEQLGAVLALVWIGGCRPMVEADEQAAQISLAEVAALCARKGRGSPQAWIVGVAHKLARPIVLARGPQKFARISRDKIAAALDAPARGG